MTATLQLRTARAAFGGRRIGMTEAEVRRIMAGYLEGTGWPVLPGDAGGGEGTLTIVDRGEPRGVTPTSAGELTLRDALVFRPSKDGRFNSDWGIVATTNGRVVGVAFSPD